MPGHKFFKKYWRLFQIFIFCLIWLSPGPYIVRLFFFVTYKWPIKLECLYIASLSTFFLRLLTRLVAYHRREYLIASALIANVRNGWKDLLMTTNVAYLWVIKKKLYNIGTWSHNFHKYWSFFQIFIFCLKRFSPGPDVVKLFSL